MLPTLSVPMKTADLGIILGLSPFLIISLLRRTRCNFSSKIEPSFFDNFSLNLTLFCSLGLEPVSGHKYTSI